MIFKTEDFKDIYKQIIKDGYFSKGAGDMWEPSASVDDLVKIANAKLQKLIFESTKLYAFKDAPSYNGTWSPKDSFPDRKPTHRASLIFVEELIHDVCHHEPRLESSIVVEKDRYLLSTALRSYCKHCRIELVAKWEAK